MCCVTSFAEVWIEIQVLSPPFPLPVSLPSRKCGLKLLIYDYSTGSTGSLPSRKCGLKFYDVVSASNLEIVTSFAEVWIEIHCIVYILDLGSASLPSRKCGLKYYKE